jgi:hypothetical protein
MRGTYSVALEMLTTIAPAVVVVAAAAALRLMWALRRWMRSADAAGAIDQTSTQRRKLYLGLDHTSAASTSVAANSTRSYLNCRVCSRMRVSSFGAGGEEQVANEKEPLASSNYQRPQTSQQKNTISTNWVLDVYVHK